MKKILSALLAVCLLICGCSGGGDSETKQGDVDNGSVLANYNDLEKIDADYLYEHAGKYKDKNVMTIAIVKDASGNEVKLDTKGNNDSLIYSFDVKCNSEELPSLERDEEICFVGKVGEITALGNCVNFSDGEIVATGSNVEKYRSELETKEESNDDSNTNANTKPKAKKKKNTKKSYMKSCKTYSYNKIKRNPDKYNGKKTKLSGKVIQVDEGWFGLVSLRVEDSNGNDWYVSYTYSDDENKLIENDKVTIYGECTGTEQYQTILGDTRRIPSIDAKYVSR